MKLQIMLIRMFIYEIAYSSSQQSVDCFCSPSQSADDADAAEVSSVRLVTIEGFTYSGQRASDYFCLRNAIIHSNTPF